MPKNNNPAVPGSHTFVDPNASSEDNRKILQDPATDLAIKRGQYIEIFHIPSGESIVFKAYIEGFQDKYDSTWNDAEVYGRMDPIRQFAGTKRIISLDWIVPSYSVAEAKFHHNKCGLLFSMLYPNYDVGGALGGVSSATQISTAPVFKVKFGNLIQDAAAPGGGVEDSGLVGAITGFVYEPNVEAGFIDDLRDGYGTLYPKEVKLSMEYTVFHTHGLGWDGTRKRTSGFPYGDGTASSTGESGTPENMAEAIESAIEGIFS
jgi:hypothetical protein